MRKTATRSSASAACPDCGGSGYVLGDNGATRCKCQLEVEAQRAYKLARIPRKFLGKSLATYHAKSARQKEVLQGARSFEKTFRGNQHDHPGKGLLLTGKEGTGKTHIAVAILKDVIAKGYAGLYWNVPELFLELRRRMNDSPGEENEAELFDQAGRVDLLVLDDLGAERTSEYVLDRLYVLINGRYQNDRATIITTNRSIPELRQQIGARITSRICEMCVQMEFPEGDYRLQNLR